MQQIAVRHEQMAISPAQAEHSRFSLGELARMAECRETSLSEQTFLIYVQELRAFAPEDIKTALRTMDANPESNTRRIFQI